MLRHGGQINGWVSEIHRGWPRRRPIRACKYPMALGVTFPFNITIGMPLYYLIVGGST
jgi:hypothetical protein